MNNRVAIVTGSSAGIGYAIAETLSKAGASVVINGRTAETLEEAESAIELLGGKVLAIRADASKESDIERIIAETISYFGRIDILVNNAAAVGVGIPTEDYPLELWDEILSKNLRAPFVFAKSAIPYLKESAPAELSISEGYPVKTPFPLPPPTLPQKRGLRR